MANALANLFTDIADSIRSKTGSTEKMSPSDFPSQIDNISVGGGGAEGCVTVTFMNGANVLLTRPVYIGDDCPDPVTQGRIETPTKESTVQYHYTYSGWTSVDGGTADSNVLKNITEDKVVYSAYSESVRKYTITYYDEDGVTVLHTEQLGYGSVPSYTPTKDGFAFDKWTPTPVAVTGNASYTASWSSAIASGTCGDSITWSLSTDYIMSINGTGDMTNYVSETSRAWDTYKADITAVVISDGITSIGDFAFCGFKQITNIAIPNSVTSINKFAFYGCSGLTSITIPSTVTSIGNKVFDSCSKLENVTILNGITSIGNYMFQLCFALTSITIPVSVTSIGNSAFNYCSKLADVYYSGSEMDKANITIGTNNTPLTDATWHYNYTN